MGFLFHRFGTLVLASESPRRASILRQLGFDFIIHPSHIEERFTSTVPVDIACELAERKAQHVAEQFPEKIVLGADTIVVLDHHILGKPESTNEAEKMLKMLSGRTHQVYTAFSLIQKSKNLQVTDYELTDVTFHVLGDEEIQNYIATGSPMDKAGAYGIQDSSAIFVERISGDFYNVVGLPASRVYQALCRHFLPQ